MRKFEQGSGVVGGFVVVAFLLLLVGLFTSMRFIDTGKIGVVTSYGKVTGRELTEGFAWVSPFGINNVTQYDIKTLKEEQKATAATKDLQDVTGKVVLNYRLERGEVSDIHKTVGVDYKNILITPAIQEVFKASTAKYTALELINSRERVKNDVVDGLTKRLAERGIVVEDVSITDIKYSVEFTKAIEQRQVAQQQAERAKYNLERAKLDAQSQDVQAKTLTDNYLQMQAIEKWDGKMPQYVGGNANVFGIKLK